MNIFKILFQNLFSFMKGIISCKLFSVKKYRSSLEKHQLLKKYSEGQITLKELGQELND